MRLRRDFLSFRRKKSNSHGAELCPKLYDMRAINNRVYLAAGKVGKTRIDLAELFGLDPNIPLHEQPPEKIPRPTMESMARVANFLGVSVRWLLHGEPENEVDLFVSSITAGRMGPDGMSVAANIGGPAVLQKNENCSTVIVKNIQGEYLTDQEREILSAFRGLRAADQAAVISYLLSMDRQ